MDKSNNGSKNAVVVGSIWTLGGYSTAEALRLGTHVCLAWFLAPEVFGLMAIVNVFTRGMQMFSDVGIQPSIIQAKRGGDSDFLNTAWTIQVFRGGALWVVACLLAKPVAMMFARNDPAAEQLVYLIPAAAFAALISGFESTALATLNKNLKLAKITILEVCSQIVGLLVTLAVLLITPTVWAIVAGLLASASWKTILSHRLVKGHVVHFRWDSECASELMRFGRWIFLSSAFTFLSLNLDRIILGNILPMSQLGLYSIAVSFSRIPNVVCGRLSVAVLFPMYARYSDDPRRMMSAALRAREAVLSAGLGVCLAMVIGARLFFDTLWDDRYQGLVSISQCMVFYVWAKVLLFSMERIPLALGNSRALFVSNMVRCLNIPAGLFGYWVAELPGFILGMSCGPIAGQLQLLRHLPSARMKLWNQGVRFTVMGLVYGIPAVILTEWLFTVAGYWSWAAVVVLLVAIPVIAAASMTWLQVRSKNSLRPASDAPFIPTAGVP